MKLALWVVSLVSGASAFAVNTENCPSDVRVLISNVSAYSSSVNSSVPGWTEARDLLASHDHDRELQFKLVRTTASVCTYKTVEGETAQALSVSINDPEVEGPYTADFLLISFSQEKTQYSLFPLIGEMSKTGGIRLFGQSPNHRYKIRTKLSRVNGRPVNFNVGLARVEVR